MALASLIYDGLLSRVAWKTRCEKKHISYFLVYFSNSIDYYRFFMYSMNTEEGTIVAIILDNHFTSSFLHGRLNLPFPCLAVDIWQDVCQAGHQTSEPGFRGIVVEVRRPPARGISHEPAKG
jgi:hypothetical protein